MFQSFQTGFSLVNAAVVCVILERVSGLEPPAVITEPRHLKRVTVSSFCPFTFINVRGHRRGLMTERSWGLVSRGDALSVRHRDLANSRQKRAAEGVLRIIIEPERKSLNTTIVIWSWRGISYYDVIYQRRDLLTFGSFWGDPMRLTGRWPPETNWLTYLWVPNGRAGVRACGSGLVQGCLWDEWQQCLWRRTGGAKEHTHAYTHTQTHAHTHARTNTHIKQKQQPTTNRLK